MIIRSTPISVAPFTKQPDEVMRFVEIDLEASGRVWESLGRYEPRPPTLAVRHDYLPRLVGYVLGYDRRRRGGDPNIPDAAWPAIREAVEPLFGEPGTGWTATAGDVIDAVLRIVEVIDVDTLSTAPATQPQPSGGATSRPKPTTPPTKKGKTSEKKKVAAKEKAGSVPATADDPSARSGGGAGLADSSAVVDGVAVERFLRLGANTGGGRAAKRAASTIGSYASDVEAFTTWCQNVGVSALPALPATVAGYLAHMAAPTDDEDRRAVSTIQRRVAAISDAHQTGGHLNPCADPMVKQVMRGIRTELGTNPTNPKTSLTLDDLQAIVATLDETSLTDTRDRALLLVGFAAGFSRSELVALDTEHIIVTPGGLTIDQSNTDPIQIGYGNDEGGVCPVRAYTSWMTRAGITTGPVFRGINRHGTIAERALTPRAVADIIKKRVTLIGYDPKAFSGRSLHQPS